MNILDFVINKFKNIIRIGYISLDNINDSESRHIYSVSHADAQFNSYAIYPYGLSANAPSQDTQAVIFNIQDSQGVTACIPVNQKDRFRGLKVGEVKIGNYIKKNNIFFNEKGGVEITSTSDEFIIKTKDGIIEISKDNIQLKYKNATLTLNDQKLVSSVPIEAPSFTDSNTNLSTHTHIESGGGTTGQPQ